MTAKDAALQQLSSASQRQLLESLADSQSLPDTHPIWATVAMLGAVVGETSRESREARAEIQSLRAELRGLKGTLEEQAAVSGEISATLSQMKLAFGNVAHLDRRMPEFLASLESAFGSIQERLASIETQLARLPRK